MFLKDNSKKRTSAWPRIIVAIIIAAALILYLKFQGASFNANFLVYLCIFVIASQGWNVLGGYIGEISFGHAVFWGIGAYSIALPMGYGIQIPPYLSIPLGAIVAGLFALLISYPLLRVRGFPFLIGSYGLAVIFQKVFIATPELFATRGVFARSSMSTTTLYISIACAAVVVTVGLSLFVNSSFGLQFKAVRDVPGAAEMIGINLYRTRTAAFVLSAFICGLAGGFYFFYSGYINPLTAYGFDVSIAILLGPYLGGIGTVMGPVLGTVVVIFVQEWARASLKFAGGHQLVLGIALVLVMMFSPKGVLNGLQRIALFFKDRLFIHSKEYVAKK